MSFFFTTFARKYLFYNLMRNIFRTLLSLSCGLILAACTPLQIVLNTTNTHGEHIILTSNQPLFGDYSIALGVRIADNDTVLGMLVTCEKATNKGVFDLDDQLQIRLADQSVITLKNLYDHEWEAQTETHQGENVVRDNGFYYAYNPWGTELFVSPYSVTHYVPYSYTTVVTKSYALYLISYQELKSILEQEVIKLRIDVGSSAEDMPSPGKMSKLMQNLAGCLYEAVQQPDNTTF